MSDRSVKPFYTVTDDANLFVLRLQRRMAPVVVLGGPLLLVGATVLLAIVLGIARLASAECLGLLFLAVWVLFELPHFSTPGAALEQAWGAALAVDRKTGTVTMRGFLTKVTVDAGDVESVLLETESPDTLRAASAQIFLLKADGERLHTGIHVKRFRSVDKAFEQARSMAKSVADALKVPFETSPRGLEEARKELEESGEALGCRITESSDSLLLVTPSDYSKLKSPVGFAVALVVVYLADKGLAWPSLRPTDAPILGVLACLWLAVFVWALRRGAPNVLRVERRDRRFTFGRKFFPKKGFWLDEVEGVRVVTANRGASWYARLSISISNSRDLPLGVGAGDLASREEALEAVRPLGETLAAALETPLITD